MLFNRALPRAHLRLSTQRTIALLHGRGRHQPLTPPQRAVPARGDSRRKGGRCRRDCAECVVFLIRFHSASPSRCDLQASLKLLVSWWPDREILNEQACLIRESFEANRGASVEQGAARRLVRETEETIDLWIHPDKYTIPYMPGSSKFMRNAPPPLEAVYPHGIPAEIAEQVIPIHPDGIPYSYRPNNEPLLIDPMSKKIL